MTISRRRQTREKVLQVLYAHELSGEPILSIMEEMLSELKANRDDFEFAKSLVHTVLQHMKEIDKLIKSKVMHWESDRIAVVDRMILRLGIAELLYFPDIPPKVTINEAIEIGKVFSTALLRMEVEVPAEIAESVNGRGRVPSDWTPARYGGGSHG